MYNPPAFREDRLEVLHAAIHAHPLGLLVTGEDGLVANPVPFLIEAADGTSRLRAHLSRANPQLDVLCRGVEALVVFQGPQAYVTPAWYASKAETSKVVPTWNYVMVQVRGRARVIDDADWLRRQINDLTEAREQDRDDPWAVADAPEAYVEAQLKGIVGLEILIDTIEGKWKASQNRSEADRQGVAEGLGAEGALDIARLVGGDR